MKTILNYILLLTLLLGKNPSTDYSFNFINDSVKFYGNLNKINAQFNQKFEGITEKEVLKSIINQYNTDIDNVSTNHIKKYLESDNKSIVEIASFLSGSINELIKLNNEYLDFFDSPKFSEKKLVKKTKALKRKHKEYTSILSGTSARICGISVKDFKNMQSELTLEQRELLNELLVLEFGEDVKKGSEFERESSFDYVGAFIYKYINLSNWKFKEE